MEIENYTKNLTMCVFFVRIYVECVLCPNTCRMDGVSLLGKLGTANRDLCRYGMSMLGC